jgi:protocatechuate 3,4-dioxygenase beta subunit
MKNWNRRQILFIFGAAGAASVFGFSVWPDERKSRCVITPLLTEGPFFVDEKLNRSDVISGQPGLPLNLEISVYTASSATCAPVAGAQIDIWHANAAGYYSDVDGATSENFLRGYQVTDPNGKVSFKTIYPGWYPGRTPHIHLKARMFNTNAQTLDATTQLFFDDAISDAVYAANAPYNNRGTRHTRNANDDIYGGHTSLLTALKGSPHSGYTGYISIAVK